MKKKILGGLALGAAAVLAPFAAMAQMTSTTIADDLDDITTLFQELLQVVLQHWLLFLIGVVVVVGAVIFAVRKIRQLFHGGGR